MNAPKHRICEVRVDEFGVGAEVACAPGLTQKRMEHGWLSGNSKNAGYEDVQVHLPMVKSQAKCSKSQQYVFEPAMGTLRSRVVQSMHKKALKGLGRSLAGATDQRPGCRARQWAMQASINAMHQQGAMY